MDKKLKQTGLIIRQYRQAQGMSLSQFAALIHKSKPTVSKYENGQISIDLETLYEISDVLNLPASRLLVPDETSAQDFVGAHHSTQYLYSAARGKLSRSLLEHYYDGSSETLSVDFFYDIPSYDQRELCIGFYHGTMYRHGNICNYHLTNHRNRAEHTFLCYLESLNNSGYNMGLLSSLSYTTMFPNAIKVVLSSSKLPEDDTLRSVLTFDREDLARLRKENMLSIKLG